ncbi:MAG: carbohydrate-binding protein [Clostridiales bacterium]|nr:carbohydrate-binding protein [Clostridiales bacterium]
MLNKSKMYEQNGLFLSKQKMAVGDEITVGYKGLLLTSGAQQVYMRIGYGEMWDGCEDMPMMFSDGMFKIKFKLKKEGQLGMAFRDPAENWDNNSGQNYNFNVEKKVSKVKKAKCDIKAKKKTRK